jgi:integrase
MSKRFTRRSSTTKRPKAKLGLPDLDHSKAAVLDSLRSPESKRAYRHAIDEFIQWYPDPSILKGKRHRAILAVLLGCGLRRRELADLDTSERCQCRIGSKRRWTNGLLQRNLAAVKCFDAFAEPVGVGEPGSLSEWSGMW